MRIKLPPSSNGGSISPSFDLSPSYVASIDGEFSRVYEEYQKRLAIIKGIAEDIVNLWAELGTPQAQTESMIIKHYREKPEQLGLHEQDIRSLRSRRQKLLDEKEGREHRLQELRTTIEGLWERLNVDDQDRRKFLARNRGFGLRTINEFEAELDRLNELKRQNLHIFVEDARYKLQELWDSLYFAEEEMLEFTPAFSDVYSDALLSAHEGEIQRLETLREQRAPTLQLIEKHRSLVKDRDDLAASSQDGSRLLAKPTKGEKRGPTRLLREEKMRKRIAKDLPKVEAELKRHLEKWEDEYARPFCVHGEPYLETLEAASARAPPPRPKTPSALPPSTTKTVPTKPPASVASSRAGSTVRTAPPNRSGAKAPVGNARTPAGTVRGGNPLSSSVIASATSGKSPTRIPARVPLGTMRHGNNSPERKQPPPSTGQSYASNTLRKPAPPNRAPPPKMRDLFNPPPAAETPVSRDQYYQDENVRCASVASSTGSGSVRQITPEDVYDDRVERMSYAQYQSYLPSHENTPQNYREAEVARERYHYSASEVRGMGPPPHPNHYQNRQHPQQSSYHPHHHHQSQQDQNQQRYIHNPADSRQISSTSTTVASSSSVAGGASGSENWETYDDASDDDNHHDAYPTRHQMDPPPPTKKRGMMIDTPAYGGPKKLKGGGYGERQQQQRVMVHDEGGRMVSASENGSQWTDEEAF